MQRVRPMPLRVRKATMSDPAVHPATRKIDPYQPTNHVRIVTAASRYVGRVNINGKCQRGPDHFPFTGKRDSALGTVSIEEALRRFCISTVVATPEYPANTLLWKKLQEDDQEPMYS